MLKLEDFDFYYLIIWSRGPGSETITISKLNDMEYEIEMLDTSEDELAEFGICEVTTNVLDEGPVIAVPKGTMPLKAIYEWLQLDAGQIGDGYPDFDYAPAYISACLRVFLTSDIKADSNPWTSINGWRKVEIELPNKAQFEALMEATGETAEQLRQWECAVLKEAAKRYLEGQLPEHEFRGC
jgi:hypothetical protein